jgi:cytoskeletal protein CcmA (bactofilin family)
MKIEVKPNGVTLFGHAVVTGNVTMYQDLTVLGKATINGVGLVTTQQIENLFVTYNATFNNKVFISGPLSVSTGITISGSLNGNGIFSFTNNSNNLTINSNGISISSNVNITGFATCNGPLYVSGAATFNSQISLNNGLAVSGNITMNASSIFLSGNVGISGGLVITGNITGANLYISGAATFNSLINLNNGLAVSGNVSMSSPSIFLSGNVGISGGLVITGNITGSNLYISGAATFNSVINLNNGLAVLGNVSMSSPSIFLSGNVGISGGLVITGNITGSNLYISGAATFNSLVNLNNGLAISGNVSMNSPSIFLSGNVGISGSLIVTGNSNFNTINARDIFINNTKTTPVFSTYLDINGSVINYNITYGNNIYIANPYIPSVTTTALNVGQITSMDFSGNNFIVGGRGGNKLYYSSGGGPNTSNIAGSINSIFYLTGSNYLYIAGTFPCFAPVGFRRNISVYNYANTIWYELDSTDSGAEVNVIKRAGNIIWVGSNGKFNGIDGGVRSLGYISDINSNFTPDKPDYNSKDSEVPLDSSINDILVTGTKVYIVGNLSDGTTSLFKVNLTNNPLSSSFINVTSTNLNGPINSLGIDTIGNLYLGGSFIFSGCSNIVKYNTSSQNFETIGTGLANTINAITLDNLDTLYVGTITGLFRYNPTSTQFEKYPLNNTANVDLLVNRNGLYYSDNTSLNYFPLRYSFLTFTNPIYDGGSLISNVQFKNSGDNIQIAATSTFGTVISKSSNLTINY